MEIVKNATANRKKHKLTEHSYMHVDLPYVRRSNVVYNEPNDVTKTIMIKYVNIVSRSKALKQRVICRVSKLKVLKTT